MPQPKYEVSAAAVHAARTLIRHFELQPRLNGKYSPTERNIAIIIDVCTQAFRLEATLTNVTRTLGSNMSIAELREHTEQVREALRVLETMRNRMPRFEPDGEYSTEVDSESRKLGQLA